jgi:hypothetical protein
MLVACLAVLVASGFCGPAAQAQGGLLYAPTWYDNPVFRATLSALFGGAPVDYWDARISIPPVSVMAQYEVVLTWVNYPYADPVLMGDRLADYVDQGGRAILGPWCYPHGQPNYLQGRIMTAAYCPAVIVSGGGAYNHDGTDCVHYDVSDYTSEEVVNALQPWAQCDGTVGSEGKSAVAWRGDRRVYYSGAQDTYGPCFQLTVNMCWCPAPASGACCDLNTGVCVDTSPAACDDTFYAMFCADLDPPCGPGGDVSVLCAPSNPDNPAFRSALAALVGGPVHYWNAYTQGTPPLSTLLQYDCVLTWVQYPYGDPVGMGDTLADYVDLGGKVILGASCYPHGQSNYLQGRIMTAAYCPAIIGGTGGGAYNQDGTDCVHDGVTSYTVSEVVDTLQPGAQSDGTVGSAGKSGVAWRGDRLVYYSCSNTGSTSASWVPLTANMVLCPAPAVGACCNLYTGECVDSSPADCDEVFYGRICAALDPPCGNPGACCDDSSGVCLDGVVADACTHRAVGGTLCADITPSCGEVVSVLYAPSNPDNASFRSALAALVGGPIDYLDTRTVTPTLDQLLQYDCVFTWANYSYAAAHEMGNVLADYVDAGGRVILGQWAWNGLSGTPGPGGGRILQPEYCPVASLLTSYGSGTYAGDGSDCVNLAVGSYQTDFLDEIGGLNPGASSDGTFAPDGTPVVAWRPDRRVYYSPGNTGGEFGAGDWVTLTANMCTCPAAASTGDLNCDGAVNGYDIDPFVLALTDPAAYGEQFADCDYMLADCNQDGAVNGYDIDPFVSLLTGAK